MMGANVELKRVKEWAWIRGFANLYQKESRAWWSTHRWWINGLLWSGLVVGMMAAVMFLFPAIFASLGQTTLVADNGGLVKLGLKTFFDLGALAITIGVIILCQDLIIGEKQTGLTEYLLANPVQRRAYVLAKLCASLVAVLLLLIALPGAAACVVISLGTGELLPLQPFLIGMGIMVLHSLFYLTLSVMLGVFFNSRSPILGIPLGILFFGYLFAGLLKPLWSIGPWMLMKYAEAIAGSQPLPSGLLWPPILATVAWYAVFTCAALIKFERTEF
jgi:ABC-type transport system involved in multi-copper enzyme maturation permease subunit